MSTVSIPSQFVNLLREVLVGQLAECAGEIKTSGDSHPDAGIDPNELEAFDIYRALLDQVGSVRTAPAVQVEVELRSRVHRETLTTALRRRREFEQYMMKVDSGTPDGAKQYRDARRYIRQIEAFISTAGLEEEGGGVLTIPAETVALVRSGLLGKLGDTGGDISDAVALAGYDRAAQRYTEPLKRLDSTRALLDIVSWEVIEKPAPVAIDLDTYRDALLDAALNDFDHQTGQAEDPDISDEARMMAEANAALLENLIAAIEGPA
jgi:hypothetical protein